MTNSKHLVDRVSEIIGYDDTNARNVILEIAKWLEEDGSHCGPRCAFRLEQQADDYSNCY